MKITKEEVLGITEEFIKDGYNIQLITGLGLAGSLVSEFNVIGGQELYGKPVIVCQESANLSIALLQEELDELKEAYEKEDIVAQLDAQIDLFYVLLGAVMKSGLGEQFVKGFIEVHKNNMEKFPEGVCTRNANGKIIKPHGFKNIDLGEHFPELKTV